MSDTLHLDAKRAVVENFNKHRNPDRSEPLTEDDVVVIWTNEGSESSSDWRAFVISPIVRNLHWGVNYRSQDKSLFVTVFRRINKVKVARSS